MSSKHVDKIYAWWEVGVDQKLRKRKEEDLTFAELIRSTSYEKREILVRQAYKDECLALHYVSLLANMGAQLYQIPVTRDKLEFWKHYCQWTELDSLIEELGYLRETRINKDTFGEVLEAYRKDRWGRKDDDRSKLTFEQITARIATAKYIIGYQDHI